MSKLHGLTIFAANIVYEEQRLFDSSLRPQRRLRGPGQSSIVPVACQAAVDIDRSSKAQAATPLPRQRPTRVGIEELSHDPTTSRVDQQPAAVQLPQPHTARISRGCRAV